MRPAALLVFLVALPAPAAAQIPGIDAWAQAVTATSSARWVGQRVPEPPVAPRPVEAPDGLVLPAEVERVAVHAAPRDHDAALVALGALEGAALALRHAGWTPPAPDAGRGGTAGFDLYLVPGTVGYSAQADGAVLWSPLDASSGFATLDPDLDARSLASCAVEAYADVALLGTDPAEAPAWRRATAAWLAWMVTGRFGCDEDAVRRAAAEPWRAPVPGPAEVAAFDGGAGGALFLALLDARESGGTGVFVREGWQFARQRTWEGLREGLRGSPDLGQTLELSLVARHEELGDVAADLAVLRAGWAEGRSRLPAVAALPRLGAPPPVSVRTLPAHPPPTDPPLEVLGSSCTRVDVAHAPAGSRLRVWLEGEYGVEWALVAVRRAASGAELGRITAPPRRLNPRSYVAVEPLDGAADVLACAVNLGAHTRDVPRPANAVDDGFYDADRDRPDARAARFTFALASD